MSSPRAFLNSLRQAPIGVLSSKTAIYGCKRTSIPVLPQCHTQDLYQVCLQPFCLLAELPHSMLAGSKPVLQKVQHLQFP